LTSSKQTRANSFHLNQRSEELTSLLLYCEKSWLLEARRKPLLCRSTAFKVEKGGRTFLSSSESAPHLRRGCLSSSDSAPNFRNGRCADKHSMSLCSSTIIQQIWHRLEFNLLELTNNACLLKSSKGPCLILQLFQCDLMQTSKWKQPAMYLMS
jgi:hypothetical protein